MMETFMYFWLNYSKTIVSKESQLLRKNDNDNKYFESLETAA